MSKITEIMTLIEFPEDAIKYFDEIYEGIENNESTKSVLEALEEFFFENFYCDEFAERLRNLAAETGYHEYSVNMVFLLHACIRLKKIYAEKGYDTDFFKANMTDLKYKLIECKKLHGIHGTTPVNWHSLFFKMTIFALGRLQYEYREIPFDYKDLAKCGDTVLTIHIPSSGPLTPESVDESLKKAYEFFGSNCRDGLLLICSSWLLYPPTASLYPAGSNLESFYKRFEIVDEKENPTDSDLWRIFYTKTDDYKTLPRETSLQKAFYDYLNDGGHFGNGFGVIVYKPEQ